MSLPSGSTDLNQLLSSLKLTIHDETFVYTSLPPDDVARIPPAHIQMMFREPTATTVILPVATAESLKLPYLSPCHMITLTVHSSLEAVGFIAVIARRLAEKEIPCNTVAGFYHDHLFIPVDKSSEAMAVLGQVRTDQQANAVAGS